MRGLTVHILISSGWNFPCQSQIPHHVRRVETGINMEIIQQIINSVVWVSAVLNGHNTTVEPAWHSPLWKDPCLKRSFFKESKIPSTIAFHANLSVWKDIILFPSRVVIPERFHYFLLKYENQWDNSPWHSLLVLLHWLSRIQVYM